MQQLSLEVAAHLEEHREVTLFCFDSGGHPIGYPMMITDVWTDSCSHLCRRVQKFATCGKTHGSRSIGCGR